MKISILILIVSMVQVSASTFAQSLTITADKAPMAQVLKEIRKQSGYKFIIDGDLLKRLQPVSVSVKNASLEEALSASFSGQPVSYEIVEKTIFVKAKESSLFNVIQSAAKNLWKDLIVKGKVTDQDGKPLPNASIRIKDSGSVTNTNEKGMFEIKGVEEDAVLFITYIGYKTLEIPLKGAVMPLEIKLNPRTGELQEVKVVYNTGYQELNLKNTTGSVVQIDNELFNRQVGTNVLDRIYNITSGLIANANARGASGKDDITIRGVASISNPPTPLIVVDNFPYEGDLNTLNPNDVASITVLKDAAASAIWGVRAGNGVIVINTKKGRFNQATQVSLVSNVTVVQKPDLFYIPYLSSKDIIDFEAKQFATGMYDVYDDLYPQYGYFPVLPQSIELMLAARKRGVTNPTADPGVQEQLIALGKHDIRNDINRYLLRNAVNQQYAFNISGGGDKYSYYASSGYDRNLTGNVKESNSRLSLNLNSSYRPIKQLEINTSLVHTRSNSQNGGISYGNVLPTSGVSIYNRLADEQGNPLALSKLYRTAYVDTAKSPVLLDWHYRPLEEYDYTTKTDRQTDIRILAGLKYTIIKGLSIKAEYQTQKSIGNNQEYIKQESFVIRDLLNATMTVDPAGNLIYPFPKGDMVNLKQNEFSAWNLRGMLSFDKSIGNHSINAVLGAELRETETSSTGYSLVGVDRETQIGKPFDFAQILPARPFGSKGFSSYPPVLQGTLARNGSHYANVAYSYKNKYFFSASGRLDESNFFGLKVNLRRQPLWSAGLGWNVNQENFYKITWLSQLKLKASYGYTGNTAGGTSYATFRYRSPSDDMYVPKRNITYGELMTSNNPQLSWERIKIVNLGLDFSLKGERIQGSVEHYIKNGLDLIGPIETEPTTGVGSYTGNYASIKGRGWDINLSSRNLIGKLQWSSYLSVSFNKDKLTAFGEQVDFYSNNIAIQKIIGKPLSSLYSYRWAGLDPSNGDPRLYAADWVFRGKWPRIPHLN